MIWQNPWAWLGLLSLAVPLLIHLLGRRSARTQRFPTLRFIEATAPVATRRTRLTDIPLLSLRMAILAVAVAALALPLLLTADRERSLGRAIARAIVVDTSVSMSSALDLARREASRFAADAATAVVIETGEPAVALRGAAAWLASQPGRHELVIVSDFQRGAVDSIDIARVPLDVGLELVPVATQPLVNATGSDTGRADGLVVLAGAGDRAKVEAARRAASELAGSVTVPEDRPVTIVYDSYGGRDSIIRAARPLSAAWQGDLLARLRADRTLADAAAAIDVRTPPVGVGGDSIVAPFTAVARTASQTPVVSAAADRADGRVLLLVSGDAGSLVSAATFTALARAASPATSVAELEPSRLDEATLATWRRAPAAASSTRTNSDAGQSDGRWLWLIVLALLGVESWMRRGRREAKAAEVVHERAA